MDPAKTFEAGETILIFDELQEFPEIATSLKFFKLDDGFDVILSGLLHGVQYKRVESHSVGYKTDYTIMSMDYLKEFERKKKILKNKLVCDKLYELY